MLPVYVSVGVIAVLLILTVFAVAPNFSAKKRMEPYLRDYAHRGLHGHGVPENSLSAFGRAVDGGFAIELDVQLSRDGQVIVFHDYTTDRMTGFKGKISELTYEELQNLSLADSEERIPLLSQVLELVDGKVPLLIELKGENSNTSLCPAVCRELEGYKGNFIVESFNPLLIRAFAKLRPDVPRGILSANLTKTKGALGFALKHLLLNFLCRVDFVAYDFSDKFPLTARLCVMLGARKLLWTPRNDEEIARSIPRCDGVIFEDNTK